MIKLRYSLTAALAGLALSLAVIAPAQAADDDTYIAIVSKGFSQQYWQAVAKGSEKAAKDLGVRITFVGPPTESDVAIQMNQLRTALNKNPDALGFAALDSRAAAPLMMEAKKRGIPVIAFDSGVNSDIPVSTVATDNQAAAAEAAKHMAKMLDYKGTVGLIIHDQTSGSGINRRDGFVNWMKKNAPDIKLLDPQYSHSDLLKSANIAKAIIASHPDLAGIFASNQNSAIGLAQAIKMTGRQDLVTVGFDSGKAQIEAVKHGALDGSITQNPVGMGYKLVETAVKVINGEDVPKNIGTGYYWYDKSNIDSPKIQQNLYQ